VEPARLHGQVISDTTPPKVVSFSFDPPSADVRFAPANVTITANITDDLAGVESACGRLLSPSGAQQTADFCMPRVSGTPLSGQWRTTIQVNRFVEPGLWRLFFYDLDDVTANRFTGPLSSPTLSVTSDPDTTAPTLVSLNITPNEVDTSLVDQPITVEMVVTDDKSGVDWANIYAAVTLSDQARLQHRYGWGQRVRSGPAPNTYFLDMVMPRHSKNGFWRAQIELQDLAGNRRYLSLPTFPLFVRISTEDAQRPRLTGFDIQPPSVDTSQSSRQVSFYLDLTDDDTGIIWDSVQPNTGYATGVRLRSPSAGQEIIAYGNGTNAQLLSGSRTNGRWKIDLTLPRYSEGGDWTITAMWVTDRVDNPLFFDRSDLERRGFPTTLRVTRPSLEPDGSLPPTGGTVQDKVFLEKAAVTVPGNVLNKNTEVSIDVFPNPPNIPKPAGYQSPGTRFVNISLNPPPTYPLPPPGLTITLPTDSYKTPGTTLMLHRLDPALGKLVPAPHVSGAAGVLGVVNADGLSATFTGVARLSTVVAYVLGGVFGDVNGDGVVDCADLLRVRAAYGKRVNQPGYDEAADRNSDGVINVLDVALVSRYIPSNLKCE